MQHVSRRTAYHFVAGGHHDNPYGSAGAPPASGQNVLAWGFIQQQMTVSTLGYIG